ncbi:MAG TPA: hypothetical protein V6D03_09665 [Candidatus Caenarcaniphilales bacterium]
MIFRENTEYIFLCLHQAAMDDREQQLRLLVVETCKHKLGSLQRQRGLTQIVRMIVKSRKLWQDAAPHYEDALQQTWMYFCRNLCEATTGDKYDPQRSSIVTWLNAYLKRRLQDYRIQTQMKQAQTASPQVLEADKLIDPVEMLAAPSDMPPILETIKQWAETDRDGELRRTHIQGHPAVTCQRLILKRLPPEASWQTLATEFNLSISTLSSFYRRQCLPRLRNFGQTQGYL